MEYPAGVVGLRVGAAVGGGVAAGVVVGASPGWANPVRAGSAVGAGVVVDSAPETSVGGMVTKSSVECDGDSVAEGVAGVAVGGATASPVQAAIARIPARQTRTKLTDTTEGKLNLHYVRINGIL